MRNSAGRYRALGRYALVRLPNAVELRITQFTNIPPAEYIGDMALYELLLVYYFLFRMKCLKGIDFLAGGDCK